MTFILGRKVGMTQAFADDGRLVPVSVIQAGPCKVLSKRETSKDGYSAAVVGFEEIEGSKIKHKSELGLFKKLATSCYKVIRECRDLEAEVGAELTVEQFKPGEKISESVLAEKFGISRTPVREAIRQLETEGFLTVHPRRGAVISSFTAQDVREFYELKALLEGFAVRKAIPYLTDEDIERMRDLNRQMVKFVRTGDVQSLFNAHNQFHEVFLLLFAFSNSNF